MVIERIRILEWYDGWIAAVVETDSLCFAGLVVAFDSLAGRRRYALVPISEQVGKRLVKLCAEPDSGEQFNTLWLEAIAKPEEVFLTDEEPHTGGFPAVALATAKQRQRLSACALPLIETAVSPQAQAFWLADPVS